MKRLCVARGHHGFPFQLATDDFAGCERLLCWQLKESLLSKKVCFCNNVTCD